MYIADILEYLFFVKPDSGKLYFYSEQLNISQYPKAYINMDNIGKDSATAEITIKNINNYLFTAYNYNYKTNKYINQSQVVFDQDSVDTYGKRELVLKWKWGKVESIARSIGRSVLKLLKLPQIIISGVYPQHFLSNLQYKDTVAVTNTRFPEIDEQPFVNALCTVKNATLNYKNSTISYKFLFEYKYLV